MGSERGGGLVTLTGFTAASSEPGDTSQLLEPFGLAYTSVRTAEGGQAVPVYYQGDTTDLKNCLAWTESSEAIITTPIAFPPQTGSLAALTYGLQYVGAFIGFGVQAPSDATVLATDPVSGENMAVAYEVDGGGRVLAFGDDWISLANQWDPAGNPPNQLRDEYNICWVPPDATHAEFFHSVATLYQTRQFWFNVITWVAAPRDCRFVIEDVAVLLRN